MARLRCVGWWEQVDYGRQPMEELEISVVEGRIFGTGDDMVGAFELNGEIREDHIYLNKRYIGKHEIEYRGQSVGEGAYAGTWSCYGHNGGRWFIGIVRHSDTTIDASRDIQDI